VNESDKQHEVEIRLNKLWTNCISK